MDKDDLARLFVSCDQDSNGYLSKNEFRRLCSELSLNENEFIALFDAVDVNRDGKIQLHEFIDKFHVVANLYLGSLDDNHVENNNIFDGSSLSAHGQAIHSSSHQEESSRIAWEAFTGDMDHVIYALPSHEKISDVYELVREGKSPRLFKEFEKMLTFLLKDVESLQGSITQLQETVIRNKEESEKHISLVEEEMEREFKLKEDKMMQDEKERYEEDASRVRAKYEKQITQLQDAIENLKQMDEKISGSSPYEKEMEKAREKLRDVTSHNASLRTKLNEADTKVALLSSQISALKLELQEKNLEFERENDAITIALSEKEDMSRQVNALFSDNRKLLDSNDDLREVIDTNYATMRRISSRLSRSPATSIVDELNSYSSRSGMVSGRSSRNSFRDLAALTECDPGMRDLTSYNNDDDTEADISLKSSFDGANALRINYAYERDSGIGTIRGDPDSESEWDHLRSLGRRYSANTNMSSPSLRESKQKFRRGRVNTNNITLSDDASEDDITDGDDITPPSMRRSKHRVRRKVMPPGNLTTDKRIYKIILCGDSSVGKSSFILRLCKDQFKLHTRSTLGVDFQTKTINLDHHRAVTLQLWDTAGQERFRSIVTSYFRKADGVILLYDVTNPDSFLNVRDWMETISNCAPDGAPVIICGNKLDMRAEVGAGSGSVVYPTDGAQLAANYGALFMETSASTGINVHSAVTSLARHLHDDVTKRSRSSIQELKRDLSKRNCC